MSGFVGIGGGGIIGGLIGGAIAVGLSKLYVGKQSFVEKTTLVNNQVAGFPYQSAVAVNGIAYVPSSNGKIYATTNFNNFAEIAINAIPQNSGFNVFIGGAHLFKVSAYPNRIYSIAYRQFGGDSNDAVGIWYSDNGCVDWVNLVPYLAGISDSNQCRGLADDNAGNLYCSVSVFGNNSQALKVIRISDGAEINALADSQGENALLYHSGLLYRVSSNTYYGGGALIFYPAATKPLGFTGYAAAVNTFGGVARICVIGKNNNTGLLQITYNASITSGSWTAATTPNISVDQLAIGFCNVASLGADKGFVAVYSDAGSGNNSGALYSADGITWNMATESPAFNNVANVYDNPLAG